MVRSVLFSFFLPLTVAAQGEFFPPAWKDSLAALLRADIPDGGPGGAVGIVYRGEVIYEDYAGLADLDTGRPIGPETRFNVASNAKQFTALCVLRLIETGALRLDDDVREYPPDLLPNIPDSLLVLHLLTHTSGLRDVYNLWSLQGITWWSTTLSNADAYALLRQQTELNFPPGAAYLYSNSNYLVLAELVSRVSGTSFAAYAGEVFADLGMHHTAFLADHRDSVANLARPYFNFDTWQTYEWLSDLHGDGALFTSLPDQLRYECLLNRPDVLPAPLARTVLASSGLPWPNAGSYGYGMEHGNYRGQPVRFHNGSTGAWKASFLRFPDLELSIVVVNNSGKFFTYDLARQVADVILASILRQVRYATVPPPPRTQLAPFIPTGIYGATEGFPIHIRRGGGDTLVMRRFNRRDVQLEKTATGRYRQTTDTTFMQAFEPDANGQSALHLYHPTHAPYTLTKTPDRWQRGNQSVNFPAGRYTNQETGVDLGVILSRDSLSLILGPDTLRTERFAERIFVTPAYTFLLAYDDNRPQIFLFDDRLRWVPFVRQ